MGTIHGGIRRVTALGRRLVALVAIALLTFTTASCAKPTQPTELISEPTPQPNRLTGQMAEVSPPAALETLKQIIDAYTPQVRILSPRPGEVLNDTTAAVRLQVRGLPLFRNDDWQLGPHLHLFIDNEPYQAIYDLSEPITFEGLSPGTHTLRVFASRPWHESFKNQGAFDQRTFHVIAPTPQNELDASAPLLTYSRPQSSYGAEPIMLDFYLTNAPLHMSAQADANDDLHDWRIRCTVNDQSFVFDQWQPIWLKGFKPGRNWVQLELIDDAGNPIDNRFNNTVRIIDYQPGGTDTLSRLVRGELTLQEVAGIIDPTYVPPLPEPAPVSEPEGTATESAEAPVPEVDEPQPEVAPLSPAAPDKAPAQPSLAPEELPDKLTEPEPTESEPAEPDTAEKRQPPVDLDGELQPNPVLQPELPVEEAPPAAIAPEADGAVSEDDVAEPTDPALEDVQSDLEDLQADLENLQSDLEEVQLDLENSPEGATGVQDSQGSPAIPPALNAPEVLPEPIPLRPQSPKDAERSASPAPASKGLIDRFKQWRSQPSQPGPISPAPTSPAPNTQPDTFGRVPDNNPRVLVNPEAGEALDNAPEAIAPDSPEPEPDVDEPSPSPLPGPDTDVEPSEEPSVEPLPTESPRVAPRSPLMREVRPFI
ncbi:hypothetical protein [Nodosilinea sp. E11]|uniref:hypothetical protein n=1 Tax=Nodosilinea sp. E11 TaxID=3037479 RepID=UPI0029348208|nr:hypothetical protein [Nodosilinea sp. E11]WOD39350.1 hypothetical protein RRF56_24385 [Nodosilinea sp. E11]